MGLAHERMQSDITDPWPLHRVSEVQYPPLGAVYDGAHKSLNPHAPQELPKYLQGPTAILPGFADMRHGGGGSLETILTPSKGDPRKLVGFGSPKHDA